jgi:class 3 adenylate cyclase
MRTKQALPELGDIAVFEHKPSEVNYGGQTRFHQAAFPPADGEPDGLEAIVFHAVRRLVQLVHDPEPQPGPVSNWRDSALQDFFYDQWCVTPRMSPQAFQQWQANEIGAVADAYRRLRCNAVRQERETDIPNLNVWVAQLAVLLIADVIHEYFEKNISLDRSTAWQLRMTLGRCLALALTAAESHADLARWRKEKFGAPDANPEVLRLINPWTLCWPGPADELTPERLLHGLNPYRISLRTYTAWLDFFNEFFKAGRWFECTSIDAGFADPQTLGRLWEHIPERKRLLTWIRRERLFREQLVLEIACEQVRTWFRQKLGTQADSESAGSLGSNRFLEDFLKNAPTRRRFIKQLKLRHKELAKPAQEILGDAKHFLQRSRRRWLGRLSRAELSEVLQRSLGRWTDFLFQYRNFQRIRSRYARVSHKSVGWNGVKLWRGYELNYSESPDDEHDRLACTPLWDRMKLEMDNAYTEGNLYLCRAQGDIYPGTQERRRRSAFLFADLRNSTETTMKLTKDTASFLTPYLTAVDFEAQACQGERIYFAGDGYAAHYHKSMDAIRAAYNLAGRFTQLRAQSSDEHRRKVKAMYLEAKALSVPWLKPKALAKVLSAWGGKAITPEVMVFLRELAAMDTVSIAEVFLMKTLVKIAGDYCMPRVDVGVGLTCGELFVAMVGSDDRPKCPIVISPALTQSARLSGSSDVVKKYIEENLAQPFPFNVFAWDKKLFNCGIAMTDDVFERLQSEVHIKNINQNEKQFEKEKFLYYYDTLLNKRIILRDIQETVALKGISKPCHLYEIILPYSVVDKLFGTSQE